VSLRVVFDYKSSKRKGMGQTDPSKGSQREAVKSLHQV